MNYKSVLSMSIFVFLSCPMISLAQEQAPNPDPVIPTMGTVIFEANVPKTVHTYIEGKVEENDKKQKTVSYTRVKVDRPGGTFTIKSNNKMINQLIDLKESKLQPLSGSEVEQTAIFAPVQGQRRYTVQFMQASGNVTVPVPYEFNKANKQNKEIFINGSAFVSLSEGEKAAYQKSLDQALGVLKAQVPQAAPYEFGEVKMFDSRTNPAYKATMVFTKGDDGKPNGKLIVTSPSYTIRVIRPVVAGSVATN